MIFLQMPTVVRATGPALARAVETWLLEALRAGPGSIVALAVGRSTLPLYGDLPADDPVWNGRRILPLDELVPPPVDPAASFVARLRAALPPALAARVDPLPPAADALEARLAADGICAAVLGLGPDGHVAFNQPGSDAASGCRIVEVTPANLARLGDVAPAARALTMGVGTLMRAGSLALIATGEGKDAARARVLDGPEGPDVPASLLRGHPALTVFG